MAEISNKALALLVLAALVVVVAATTIQLNRINAIGLTGMPTTDEGTVQLNIAASVAIEVDAAESEIDFGTCTPPLTPTVTFNSEDNITNVSNSACTFIPAAQSGLIRVENIGNVDANLSIEAQFDPNDFIANSGSNAADFEVRFGNTGCDGATGNIVSAYTTLDTTGFVACENLTFPNGLIDMYVQITLPTDALPGAGGTNEMRFTAQQSGI